MNLLRIPNLQQAMLHRSLVIICIFTFVCLSSPENTESVTISWAGQLPYQAHSFNDLNITRHLLQKGVKYFKFDVSVADRTSCKTYSTWDSKLGCFNSSYYSQQICCLSMRGDAGSQYNFQHPFNTSTEIVKLFDEFLSSATERKGIIFAAFNFQFSFEMNNPIVEEFLYQLALLSKRYKNLYFSPSNDFILEYDRLCRHSSSSNEQQKIFSNIVNYIVSDEVCTQKRRTISESPMVLQSGSNHPSDVRDYKGRFRNFNTYYKDVDRLCREGFPTWPNKYPQFPLIFWQPSNQDQIQYVYKKLFSPSCAKLHNRTVSGIAFASNIDPEMFAAYLKPTSILPSPFPWNLMNKAWLQNVSSFKMATIRLAKSERLIATWKTEGTRNYLGSFILDQKNNMLKLEKAIQLTKPTIELHGVGSSIIVISGEQGESRYMDVTAISFSLSLQKLKERSISSYIASYSSKQSLYCMSRTSSQDYFNLYVITPDLSNSTQYGVSQNLPKAQMDTLTSMYFRKGATIADDVFLLFRDNYEQTQMIQMKNGDRHKIKILTFGKRASIADRDDGTILISLQGSYSHGGILLNNNAQYKCGLHKIQASERLAYLPQLVDVLEAKIENLLQFLQQDSSEIITACDPRFALAKQINGKNVRLAHLWGRLFISSEYVHLSSQDLMISLFSGGSNYELELRGKKGFILVSFPNQASLSLNKQVIAEQ